MPGGVEARGAGADHGDADGGVSLTGRARWSGGRGVGLARRGKSEMGAARLERATPSV